MPPRKKQLATTRVPKAPKKVTAKSMGKPADTRRAKPAPKGIQNKPQKPIVHRPTPRPGKKKIKTDWGEDPEKMAWALWKKRQDNKLRHFITMNCNVVHKGTQVNYVGTHLNSTSCVSHKPEE